jgi:hydroxymethylglutaryl-CoA synthase
MVGITSIGAHIPIYRLEKNEIAKMWQARGMRGEKAVAGYDEDAITMASAAALDCMGRSPNQVGGLYFATTSAPYREKQNAAVIASAVDLKKQCHTADFANSLRAGAIALKSAVDAVKCGSAEDVLVVAADRRLGAPQGSLEQVLGDGAAAVMIGTKYVVASIDGSYSIFNDFTDMWRVANDEFIRSAEGRFVREAGFGPTMQEAVSGLLEKYSLRTCDFTKFVFYAPNEREHEYLARKLGFDQRQIQDPLYANIGNSGTASAIIMLVAALEEAKPGDRILFANYGDGCDAFIISATEAIAAVQGKPKMADRIGVKIPITYGKYLDWRDLVHAEAATLPERSIPSLQARWRERKNISALYGVQCRKCGTPQINPIGQNVRVCTFCQAKDDFERYKFSDKKAKLTTFSVDHLQPTKNPPGVNGVVDFDDGGRLMMELTDCEPYRVKIGMALEMTFRKFQDKGTVNYFWKAKPVYY